MKRCVFYLLVFALIYFSGLVARADQPPPNDFGGQIIAGVDGKRVGIGTREPAATLDVYQGEIKLGSTGATCTATLAGAIRYANKKLQLCDGAGWRNVSLDKAQ